MKTRTHLIICAVLAALLSPTFPAHAEVKVDLSINQNRSDILTRGWENWLVQEGASVSRKFDGVTVTLRGDGGAVTGAWWKSGIGAGATMASDGVLVKGAGKHALPRVPDGRRLRALCARRSRRARDRSHESPRQRRRLHESRKVSRLPDRGISCCFAMNRRHSPGRPQQMLSTFSTTSSGRGSWRFSNSGE